MDHAEVVERIEIACVEPDGLARLTAGDTPEAAAVAGHLAGCEACTAVLAWTARAAQTAREAVLELPDPDLRERTLAFIRDVGVSRSPGAGAVPAPERQAPEPADRGSERRRPRSRPAWLAAAGMAAVMIAAVAGFIVGAGRAPGGDGDALAAAQTTVHIAVQPDVAHVDLVAADGGLASGTVMYSAGTGELAMIVSGLGSAPSGSWYACWVEQAGQRRRIGSLYLAGSDGAWAGVVSGLGLLQAGDRFGVSLVADSVSPGTPVLTGVR